MTSGKIVMGRRTLIQSCGILFTTVCIYELDLAHGQTLGSILVGARIVDHRLKKNVITVNEEIEGHVNLVSESRRDVDGGLILELVRGRGFIQQKRFVDVLIPKAKLVSVEYQVSAEPGTTFQRGEYKVRAKSAVNDDEKRLDII